MPRHWSTRSTLVVAFLSALLLVGCGKVTPPKPTNDPPAAVANLAAQTTTTTSVALAWTAPGADGNAGTATEYDVRYSTSSITEANWAGATQTTGALAPRVAGTAESFTVAGLVTDTPYYFALKARDEVAGHWSGISNVAAGTPAPNPPPAAVTNLALSSVLANSATLTWTAPGADGNTGTATEYDVRFSTSSITEANFAGATPAAGEAPPHAAGTTETFTVTGLAANTPYYFALKTRDEVTDHWSALSNVVLETPPVNQPPAPVTSLAASSVLANSATLTWTAPGADGNAGTATEYDVRYSTSPINATNWGSATPATGAPAPHVAGTTENFTVSGLAANATYYFALETRDEVPANWSLLSNVASASTYTPVSTFDLNTDNWTAFQNGTSSPIWGATDGNPAGGIHIHDATAGQWAYFVAPAKFLGNQSASLGRSLQFDLEVSSDPTSTTDPSVRLEGGGTTLVCDIVQPTTAWSSYNLGLTSAAGIWRVGTTLNGTPATDGDLSRVLANVTLLRIRGEYSTVSGDNTYLDNVRFTR